ncbi:Hypothetical predicted protein [Podarcis lilfordi]|uniref:Uncharacterized protein n=1 Tax=Podarcis lilfordi TaxID=74358 RepID=A0AA35JYC2_9SAUR|nr:Hypothetical predicted protein [Podarcis lilfordi]
MGRPSPPFWANFFSSPSLSFSSFFWPYGSPFSMLGLVRKGRYRGVRLLPSDSPPCSSLASQEAGKGLCKNRPECLTVLSLWQNNGHFQTTGRGKHGVWGEEKIVYKKEGW